MNPLSVPHKFLLLIALRKAVIVKLNRVRVGMLHGWPL
jgi:hypothetical protein